MFKANAAAGLFLALAVGFFCGCGSDYRNDAEREFLKSAKKGDAEAQYNLGACYEFGSSAPRDIAAAKSWYRKAAAQGHKKAKARLRILEPPPRPTREQAAEYRAAARRGDAEAQFQWAQCCELGFHTPRNCDLALRYYGRAAAKGHEAAKTRLEELTEELSPTADAVKKYFADAKRGDAEAQFQYARCLEFGFRLKPNRAAAVTWYERAAKQGHVKALEALGRKPKRPTGPRPARPARPGGTKGTAPRRR